MENMNKVQGNGRTFVRVVLDELFQSVECIQLLVTSKVVFRNKNAKYKIPAESKNNIKNSFPVKSFLNPK
ncbi:hypothetical protein HZS_4310 [Henneguya salminicola]|nr:hypothetical protein HZS_4310 [Henneguya salminicola]